ncbi:MAG: response regulator transcription factor, partial [Acidimicrobiia bacterium]|nr:response regulator transcription factor [Acidimicrobiia bacterium]
MALTVVIAEDSLLMREGVKSVLALDDEIEIAGVCGDYDGLIAAVYANEPDAVITDIRMPPTQTDEGIRAANLIHASHPNVGVVVLSQYVEPRYTLSLFETGTSGRAYLLKERVADPGELAAAVRQVVSGGSVVDPRVVDALVTGRTADRQSPLHRLTEREMEVLAEMATGANNAAIGEALFISARSVEKHINAIFTKLDLSHTEDIHRRVR